METKSTPNKPIDQRIRTIGAIGQGICTAGMIWWFYDMFIQSLFYNPFQGTYSFSKTMESYGISGDIPGIFNMVFTVAVFMTMPVMLLFWLVRKAFGEFAKGSILSPVIARTILGVALISFSGAAFKLLYWASESPFRPLSPLLPTMKSLNSFLHIQTRGGLLSVFEWLLIGMVCLSLYWGIRQAIALKEENDLTV